MLLIDFFDSAHLIELRAGAANIQSQLAFSIAHLNEFRAGTAESKGSVEKIVTAESRALVIGWALEQRVGTPCAGTHKTTHHTTPAATIVEVSISH